MVGDSLGGMGSEERAAAIADIMARARADGFSGFGGDCFQAAVAINRVLFDGRAGYVAAFNVFFQERGRHVGHLCVCHEGVYWDADGRPKDEDDIESWGMLDPDDGDWAEAAASLGSSWDEDKALEAALFEFEDEAEVLSVFGDGALPRLEEALRAAAAAWAAGRAPGPR